MAYIESHQSLLSHPKTRRLARALNMPAVHVMGHLHALWHWALDYAQDGDLSHFEATDIADAAAWEGDPDTWLSALVECGVGGGSGFLDLTAGGGMAIHDWPDYAGKLIDRRKANAERMRQARATHETPTVEPRATHVQRTSETHADMCGANVTKLSVTKQTVAEQETQRAGARVRAVPKPKRSRTQIEYDEVTQAIGAAWRPGKAWDELTATEQQTCARCSAELHGVRGSPEQVAAAKTAWDASPKWRDLTFTPDALKKHWGELIALSSQNGTANHATNRERAQDIGALKRAAFAGGHGESTDTEHAGGRARAAS